MSNAIEQIAPRHLLPALLLGLSGCATNLPECGCGPAASACFGDECLQRQAPCNLVPPGASHACVTIDAQPTSAAIYVDGEYAGTTPLQYSMWFESNTRYIRVLAQPIHHNQTPQERLIQVPPLPRRLQFFMNNPDRTSYAGTNGGQKVESPGPQIAPGSTDKTQDAGQ